VSVYGSLILYTEVVSSKQELDLFLRGELTRDGYVNPISIYKVVCTAFPFSKAGINWVEKLLSYSNSIIDKGL